MQFESSEKFRAEMLRQVGFVFCSPFCLIILNFLLNGFKSYEKMVVCLILAFLSLMVGLYSLDVSYLIVYDVDNDRGADNV